MSVSMAVVIVPMTMSVVMVTSVPMTVSAMTMMAMSSVTVPVAPMTMPTMTVMTMSAMSTSSVSMAMTGECYRCHSHCSGNSRDQAKISKHRLALPLDQTAHNNIVPGTSEG